MSNRTAELTPEQRTLIRLAQRCQHIIDEGAEARRARDRALTALAAEGVPAIAIYAHPTGKGRAALARNLVADRVRGRR